MRNEVWLEDSRFGLPTSTTMRVNSREGEACHVSTRQMLMNVQSSTWNGQCLALSLPCFVIKSIIVFESYVHFILLFRCT
jgi:hypothetical protein